MKKILFLALISAMLTGCYEETMIGKNQETVLSEEEKQEQMEKLGDEWNNLFKEYTYVWERQPGEFGGAFSFSKWMEMLWRQFNHPFAGEGEAAKWLDDMFDTYAKCSLLQEKADKDFINENINEFKRDIEYFKILVKCIQNDRKVLIECSGKKTGKPLINHKRNDPLYEKLKQILNSLNN